jgi:hypothetical protein
MDRTCEKCGKRQAVVNLNTAKTVDGQPGPDFWLCAACLHDGLSTPQARALTRADEDAAQHRESGGQLN